MQYYYFVTGLPSLEADDTKIPWTPKEFYLYAGNFLLPSDYAQLRTLLLPADLVNITAQLCEEEEWDETGLITKAEMVALTEQIKKGGEPYTRLSESQKLNFPPFLYDFIGNVLISEENFEKNRLQWQAFNQFYDWVLTNGNPFLQKWFSYLRDMNNILSALVCKKYNLPLTEQLTGDYELTGKLGKSRAADMSLGKLYEVFNVLDGLVEESDLLDREKSIDALKWSWIEQNTFFEYFSLNRILGYFLKLGILHRWINLTQQEGEARLSEILDYMEKSFEFPDEFSINRR